MTATVQLIANGSRVVATTGEITTPLKVDQAYDELKRRIITLQLEPGAHIDERELMAALGVGRTPLREAILRLVHERLIVHSPRRGAWVSPLSITDLRQMIEARITLESLVARRAAERVTEQDVETLCAILEEAKRSLDQQNIEVVVDLDLQLHSYIGQCSGNEYIANFTRQINAAMLRYWHLSSRNAATLPTWGSNHQDLVRAIASGDPDRAEEQARRHVFGLRDHLRDLLI